MYPAAVESSQCHGQWDAFCWNQKEAAGLRVAPATSADGPAPVASGTLEERVAVVCGLFSGLQMLSTTDDDLFRPVEKRQQRHENRTDAEVILMVKAVILPIADGGLARGAFSAGASKKQTRGKEQHTLARYCVP